MRINGPCFAAALVLMIPSCLHAKEPVDYVNPFIGTSSQDATKEEAAHLTNLDPNFHGFHGKLFPGACTPDGMVQLSPDTISGGDNGAGYCYPNTTIEGFSLQHLSGVGWYGDLGNFRVTPTTGPMKTWRGTTDVPGTGYLSSYSKSTEVAKPGYYAVTLDDYHVRTELTATARCGFLRFTFPANPASRIQIDLASRVGGTSLHQTVKVTGDHSIEGQIDCSPQGGGFGHGWGNVRYSLYYHAEFSRPMGNYGTWSASLPHNDYGAGITSPEAIAACEAATVTPGCKEATGRHLGFYAEFPTRANDEVLLKVGISYVSIDNARQNMSAEIPGWDFDDVRGKARRAWADALGRMSVDGGTEDQKTIFYTALYHSLIDPRILSDVNGDYPGGDGQVHRAKGFTKRTIFSGWDVYRTLFPLLTIIAPDIVSDQINSATTLATENGKKYYDRWELMNSYTGCMTGSPEAIVINDAYQKGIRSFDVSAAYSYAVNTCDLNGKTDAMLGYSPGSVSSTLQNALAAWNVSQLATALGHAGDAETFGKLGLNYRNVFDPGVPWTYDKTGTDSRPEWKGWVCPKDKNGNWQTWEGLTSGTGAQESSLYEEGWAAPQDVPGLIAEFGGQELFVAKLSDFFQRTKRLNEWNDYMNQSNEPSELIPFLFNRAGAPWLTQYWVRRILTEAYSAKPNGLCGDDDEGQVSSWFGIAAGGLSQACPGATRYEIFTPLFDKVTFKLDPRYSSGKRFTVISHNNSAQSVYIQSARLNGKSINRCWLDYKEIVAGGTLDLTLGPVPNKQWGTGTVTK